jgi:hypothetical protein
VNECKRPAGGERRRVARDRAGGLVFVYKRHRGVAREAANLSRAARSLGKRR